MHHKSKLCLHNDTPTTIQNSGKSAFLVIVQLQGQYHEEGAYVHMYMYIVAVDY